MPLSIVRMFCKHQSYLDYSLNSCQLSFSSLWTIQNASSLGSVKYKRDEIRYKSLVFYLTKLFKAGVFGRKD